MEEGQDKRRILPNWLHELIHGQNKCPPQSSTRGVWSVPCAKVHTVVVSLGLRTQSAFSSRSSALLHEQETPILQFPCVRTEDILLHLYTAHLGASNSPKREQRFIHFSLCPFKPVAFLLLLLFCFVFVFKSF